MDLMQGITLDGSQIRITWRETAFVPPRELTTQAYGITQKGVNVRCSGYRGPVRVALTAAGRAVAGQVLGML
jgi:hypothetical protein